MRELREKIMVAGGSISFAEFMSFVLYAPSLGYYATGAKKIGALGDFITAPEISNLFSYTLANQCAEIFETLSQKNILEFGAGTGIMATDILIRLETLNCLPTNYFILDISPDLRERQAETIKSRCHHLFDRVEWLNTLPENFEGIVLANEVLDAMPVHRLVYANDEFKEIYVDVDFNEVLKETVLKLPPSREGEGGGGGEYRSEINLSIAPWIKSLYVSMKQGVVLLIDYGFGRGEYYHPERSQGTLMCHYQHRAHSNPFIYIGVQDITAHVDFTSVAEAAVETGFEILGFTTQASFLMGNNILDLLQFNNKKEQLEVNHQLQQLIAPSEMGELFKVMGLSKNSEIELQGFSGRDYLYQL
jgi:SAM-dependent MidA family methyltransferase